MKKYVLKKSGEIVEESDLLKWAESFESSDRHIAQSMIYDICVSTVFLGIDHGWLPHSKPVLFETMIFGGFENEYQERYDDIEESQIGHIRAVARVVVGALKDIVCGIHPNH